MINLTIISLNKLNTILTQSIQSQLKDGDEFIVFDLPQYPLKKMKSALTQARYDGIVIINFLSQKLSDNFLNDIRINLANKFNTFYFKRYDDNINYGYEEIDLSLIKEDDCVFFNKTTKKAILTDSSLQTSYLDILKTLSKNSLLYTPKHRDDIEQENVLQENRRIELEKNLLEVEILNRKNKNEKFLLLEREKEKKEFLQQIKLRKNTSYVESTSSQPSVISGPMSILASSYRTIYPNIVLPEKTISGMFSMDRKNINISEIDLEDE